jgi:hypothetical protein
MPSDHSPLEMTFISTSFLGIWKSKVSRSVNAPPPSLDGEPLGRILCIWGYYGSPPRPRCV